MNAEMRRLLQADAFRYVGGPESTCVQRAYGQFPGFRFTYHMRMLSWYGSRRRSIGAFAYAYHRFWYQKFRFQYGFDISPTMTLGAGFYLGHFGGVVISPAAVLGTNINIAQGVTIGAESRGERTGAPTLGTRVWIGANAVVVGRITVGEGALVAPGAYVNFDVPPDAVVLGNPGKIVSDKGSAGYVNNVLTP